MNDSQRLSELQREFDEIYSDVNRALAAEEIIMRIDEQAGYLGKSVMDSKDFEPWCVKSASWIFALANKLSISLEDAMLSKFPQRCQYCVSTPCICEITNKTPRVGGDRYDDIARYVEVQRNSITQGNLVPNIGYFVRVLRDVYPQNFTRWKENRMIFLVKLGEERAEIIEAFRRHAATNTDYSKGPLAFELADYFAWLLALWSVATHGNKGYNIQAKIAERYSYGCPYCRQPVCACAKEVRIGLRSDSSLQPTSRYEPNAARRLSEELQQLRAELEQAPELKEAQDTLESLIKAPLAASKSDILGTLAMIGATVARLEVRPSNSNKIGDLIRGIAEWLPANWTVDQS
jgi:hypothetical protein